MAEVEKKYRMKCQVNSSLHIRKGPSTSFESVGFLKNNDEVITSLESGGWYKHDRGGWSSGKYLKFIEDLGEKKIEATPVEPEVVESEPPATLPENNIHFAPTAEQLELMRQQQLEELGLSSGMSSAISLKEVRGIHGMPYQYMPHIDRRLTGDKGEMFYGRKFAEKIMNKIPMLVMTPGHPAFMPGFDEKEKTNLIDLVFGKSNDNDSFSIEELLNGNSGKYYTFEFATKDYYTAINIMLRQLASFMNVGDEVIDGKKLKDYNWQDYNNGENKAYVSGSEYVSFYIDSETQINESFSNSTTESMLSSSINSLSDMGKEVSFLLGAGAGIELDALSTDGYETNMEALSKIVGEGSSTNILSRLKNTVSTIAAGGELIFPEIWKDSNYSKSYSVKLQLRTPDPTNLGIFLDLMVPLVHILGFTLPVQMGYNGFSSPFLTRAFYKGFFSCEMGIITDLNITRGGEGLWNVNGMPTSIDIEFTLKDLYQVISMSQPKSGDIIPTEFLRNTPMMDYLANMAGVNINKPELLRTLGMYVDLTMSNIKNLPNSIMLEVNEYLANTINKFAGGLFK